jgi:hypothetical protein
MIRALLTLAGITSKSRPIPLFFGTLPARQSNALELYRGAYGGTTLRSDSYRKITTNTDS